MKKITLFQGILLFYGAVALFILFQYSQNDRYQFHIDSYSEVIDTRTGKVYFNGELDYKLSE